MTELQALGCHLYLHQQALDTSAPFGKAMFQMCGLFAEFERGMIASASRLASRGSAAPGSAVVRSNHRWKRAYASSELRAWIGHDRGGIAVERGEIGRGRMPIDASLEPSLESHTAYH